MAQVLVPGVAQLAFNGTIGNQPWTVVHHWRLGTSTADWSQANIATLVNLAHDGYSSNLAKHGPPPLVLTSIVGVDIGAAAPATFTNATAVPGTGLNSAVNNTATCIIVRNHIDARYKGGHPRSYWPHGNQGDAANSFEWTSTFVNAFVSDVVAMVQHIVNGLPGSGSSAGNHCVPLYTYEVVDDPQRHKYRRLRSGLKGVFTVSSYEGLIPFGTQRRRLTV